MAVKLIGGGRAIKVCDRCGGVDDHPRHIQAGTVAGETPFPAARDEVLEAVLVNVEKLGLDAKDRARLVRDLTDQTSTEKHIDCCAADGCLTCAPQVSGADGKTGKAMLDHIQGKKG